MISPTFLRSVIWPRYVGDKDRCELAWRYRRSTRFPGGFRVNLSKSGLGWSWGFRGFRIGRDSRRRTSRTLSIPGTGLYNRQYLGDGKTQKPSFGISCGGCVGASFGALIGLAILEKVIESGNAGSIVLFFAVALGGYVVWKLVRTSTRPSSASHPNYEALGREVNLMYIALAAPIKDELRKTRGATAYDAVFEQAFEDLICQFAVLDGTIVPAEAEVFLGIFKISIQGPMQV